MAWVLRESITNVLRHARAQHVFVTLRAEGGCATLEVADDGQGVAIIAGQGIRGMRERVVALGGKLVVEPGTAGGTRVRASIPWPAVMGAGESRLITRASAPPFPLPAGGRFA